MESDRTSPMLRVIQSQSIMNKHSRDSDGVGGKYSAPGRLLKLEGLSNDRSTSWHNRSVEDHYDGSIAGDGIIAAAVG